MPTTVSQILLPTNILTGSSSALVPSKNMVRNFGDLEDYVELHVSDPAGKILYSIIPFRNYKIPGNFQPTPESISSIQNLQFDPKTDVSNFGLTYGNYNLLYNILRPKVDLSYNKSFFIKEISADRTEIRLINNNISQIVLENNVSKFINEFKSYNYFKEFYLNFGSNNLLPAINVTYDPGNTGTIIRPASVLIKLLNPLPLIYKVNTLLSIVDKISNSQAFNVVITPEPVKINIPTLRGPNFDLDLDNLRVGPTPYYNFNQVTTFNGEFAPQLQQLLGQLSASNFSINIDYDTLDYSDWVHFSSAARRLEGFQYKLTNIEAYNKAIYSASISTSPSSQLDIQLYQNKLNETIQSFDDWEQHLFYESGSYAWPKQNSTKPYINYSVTSSQAVNWYIGNYNSASLYDDNNQNYILYALPGYITENTDNELAFKFVSSMGQMFDDIWIYIKAITDLYKAKNALDQGISKDLVYFALQSMGINTYTDEDGNNVFQYLYGVNEDGTYKYPTGSYETLISASNYQLSGQDQQKGIYKRLYHNLPLLLKSKGTNRFIQYLNTIFGIPTTIMGYTEYGGVDKVTSSFEYEYDRFTYGLNMSGSSYIDIPWSYTSQSLERTGYNDIVSNGIEFRFKAFTTASNILSSSYDTQCIFSNYAFFGLYLKYKQTGSNDSIYSGSTGNFGYLNFQLGYSNFTSSTVPIFETGSDGETSWYSVLIQRRNPDLRLNQTGSSQTYDLYIKNNVFGEIGHVASASFTTSEPYNNECWYKSVDRRVRFGTPVSSTISAFTGSLQELRLWSNYISESVFDSHVLNPESIEGNFTTSSYEDLTARFTLGNNLYTYNHSVITSVSSSAPDQNIQLWTASFGDFPNRNNYSSFVETYYADAANSGYSNPVTDKIRIYSGSEYGAQLMPHKSIEVPALIPITKDIHLLDASLSPQDEIDRAIIAQFGSTYSVDDIIGDPDSTYQEFQSLQADFFKKFYTKYNYKDYIRLIDFFHNSLFRTLKDFTPARTNVATGIVIKPHLLERPVIYRPEPTFTYLDISGSIDTAFISGSNGGDYSQSLYDITYNTPLGSFSRLSDARDFFNGELPSASIDVIEDQYNPFTQFKQNNLTGYSESIWYHDYNPLLNNVSSSIQSIIRKKSEYISTGSRLTQLLSTASLQDFYYDYYRHAAPRYIGSKVNSIDYTFYNEEDITFRTNVIGSYGKSATIDKNTTQFAFFSEATSTGSFQLAFPEATNIYIKYLINDKGSLTELSTKNYKGIRDKEFWNLYQIQNIFKNGEIANISLFDAQNPDLQKELDGNKTIWHGGFKLYPVLWRVTNTTQIYFVPDGVSAAAFYDIGNYRLDTPKVNVTSTGGIPIGPLYFFTQTRTTTITLKVTYQPAQLLPGDIIATVVLTVQPLFNFSRKQETRTMNVKIPARINGVPNYSGTLVDTWNGFLDVLSWRITNIKPANGNAPSMTFDVTDNQPWLIVDPVHKNIVSCSALLSKYYKLNDNEETNLFFSGSVLKEVPPAIPPSPNTVLSQSINNALTIYNSFCIPEYSFTLNPGDIVRFASGSNELETKDVVLISDTYTGFQAKNEYTIVEVYSSSITQPNEISYIAFKLDKNVDPFMTSSLNGQSVIHKYIFARKFPDETNVIIKHRKQPGLTSAGIIKNRNISLEVDEKIANIASDLKNKIFSTVLIP